VVETHSDHLVRRLRSLVAETPVNGELERWLIENIYIINVEQESGVSAVRSTRLTRDGSIEDWPSDFFDEATKQENTIYSAALEKEHMDEIGSSIHFDHRPESEPHDTDS
jgi:predicted ATPase